METKSKGTRFPSETLKPAGGRIHSWVFENENVQLARDHFWSFALDFRKLRYQAMDIKPSMTIEWIKLPIRRWQALEGRKIKGKYGDDGVEASFYVVEHDVASRFSLEVLRRRGTSFLVRMEMVVEFQGVAGTDRNLRFPVRGEAWLEYEGLIVPDELGKSKPTIAQAHRIASTYMDMDSYGQPEPKSRTFPPKL